MVSMVTLTMKQGLLLRVCPQGYTTVQCFREKTNASTALTKTGKPEDFCFVGIYTLGILWKFPAEEFGKFAAKPEGYRIMNVQQGCFRLQFHYRFTTAAASPLPRL